MLYTVSLIAGEKQLKFTNVKIDDDRRAFTRHLINMGNIGDRFIETEDGSFFDLGMLEVTSVVLEPIKPETTEPKMSLVKA